jgi:hypothetical protein
MNNCEGRGMLWAVWMDCHNVSPNVQKNVSPSARFSGTEFLTSRLRTSVATQAVTLFSCCLILRFSEGQSHSRTHPPTQTHTHTHSLTHEVESFRNWFVSSKWRNPLSLSEPVSSVPCSQKRASETYIEQVKSSRHLTLISMGFHLCITPLLPLRTHLRCRILQIERVQLRVLTHRRNLADVRGGWGGGGAKSTMGIRNLNLWKSRYWGVGVRWFEPALSIHTPISSDAYPIFYLPLFNSLAQKCFLR